MNNIMQQNSTEGVEKQTRLDMKNGSLKISASNFDYTNKLHMHIAESVLENENHKIPSD